MKKTFLKFLPIAAAVLLATSCGKDDNSAVVDNIATPDPVQEVLKPVAKTITITGKVNLSLSKVASDDGATLSFEGGEVFTIFDEVKNECGTLTIQDDKTSYKAEFPSETIKEGDFIATLGNYPTVDEWSEVQGYATLNDALKDAYYEMLPFKVKKSGDDTYTIGDVYASIQCALVKALSSKDIKLGHVTAGNFYIVPLGAEISNKVTSAAAGKIYKVGGKDALSGTFSVGEGKTVSFSKGNLMYRPGFGYFFADKQWSYIGDAEGNSSATAGTRDLFGWGMWLEGGTPMKSTKTNSDYTWTADAKSAIGSEWSTLTNAEWKYLLERKVGENLLYGEGSVDGKKGLIILPDDWTSSSFTYGTSSWANTYTIAQWTEMEKAGAVFLPAAGERNGTSVSNAGSRGNYWSSSASSDANLAYYVYFSSGLVERYSYYGRSSGRSVRLVSGL